MPIYSISKDSKWTDYVVIAKGEVTPVLFPRNVSAKPKQEIGQKKFPKDFQEKKPS